MSIKNKFPNIKPSLNLDFANTKRLDPRITFTRASAATYWDGKTFAKAEENLLKYSQEFDNAAWTKLNSSITQNAEVAPDGSTTAAFLKETNALAIHQMAGSGIPVVPGEYVFSVHISKTFVGTRNFAVAPFNTGSPGGTGARFVIFNQSGNFVAFANSGSDPTYSILDLGAYWRISVVGVAATSATVSPTIRLYDGVSESYQGDATSGLYIWGAQFEQRSQATAYTPTTDKPITKYQPALQTAASGAARFDHNPVTGESLGLLVEEQRTNLLLRSEEFNNAAWTKTNSTINANAVVSPDGTVDADELVDSTTSGAHTVEVTPTVTSGASYTLSVYAKAYTLTKLMLQLDGNDTVATSTFNLSNGTVESTLGGSATITAVGNGWYRCAVTGTTVNTAPYVRIRLVNAASSPTYAGTGQSLFIWGAQLEAGAFATSYIPTTSEQVTRAAESAVMTGTNFSSWYRQDEGTAIVEGFIQPQADGNAGNYYLAFSDGTISNLMHIADVNGTRSQVITSGVSQFDQILGAEPTSTVKAAVAYKMNDSILSASGVVSPSADTSVVLPVVNRLTIGNRGDNSPGTTANGTIKKIAYYPKRLTNTELQALTA